MDKYKGAYNSRRMKKTAVLTAALFVCFMAFAVFFISVEAHHDCSGENCPVCALIQLCGDTVRGAGTASGLYASASAGIALAALYFISVPADVVRSTQVSEKVRMDA